jgi:hypothetical protein
MYCTKCGAQNPDGANFCQNCGSQLVATTTPAQSPPPITTTQSDTVTPITQGISTAPIVRRTSGIAVAALVLGIIGLFAALPAILAIIFGGIGISQTSKDQTLGGHGLAVAGLVLGIIGVAFWAFIVFLMILVIPVSTTITTF